MTISFNAGRGRLVQGDPTTANPVKDQKGQPVLNKDNTPRTEYFAGIGYPKGSAEWAYIQGQLEAEAIAGWGSKLNPKMVKDFSWKYFDGDGTDKYGKPLTEKNPALAGMMVLRANNGYAPSWWARQPLLPDGHPEKANYQPGTEGALIQLDTTTAKQLFKRGFFVRPFVEVKINDNMESPGVYVNLLGIELFEFGEEIHVTGGPSGEEMFGGAATPPAGAAAPTASAPAPAPTASHTSYMAPPPAPPAPPPAPPAPPASGPELNAAGKAANPGQTYASFIAAGWSPEQLKAAGFID